MQDIMFDNYLGNGRFPACVSCGKKSHPMNSA